MGAKSSVERQGVSGTHRGLDITSSPASAAAATQMKWISAQVELVWQHGYAPLLQRHWDATSNRMAFGSLQGLLASHASSSIRDADGHFTFVDYEQFAHQFKVARYGVLDMLAQGGPLYLSRGPAISKSEFQIANP